MCTPAAVKSVEVCPALPSDFVLVLESDVSVSQCFIMHTKYILANLNFDSMRCIYLTEHGWLSVFQLLRFELKQVVLHRETNCFSSELSD